MGDDMKGISWKDDLAADNIELQAQIGSHIKRLYEIRKKEGKVKNQADFYNKIFPEMKYQKYQSTIADPAENPDNIKSDGVKNNDIGGIFKGENITLALLQRISEKFHVSMDSLFYGIESQPSAPTCPPEGKDASPAGDNVMESQTEKEPSAEMGSPDLPPEESDKTTTDDDDLHYSPYDILKAFESLSCIADLKIDSLSTDEGRLGNEGLRIDIRPKEIILPVLQDESKLSLFINLPVSPSNHLDEVDFLKKNRGIANDGFTYCYLRRIDNERIPASAYALHLIDTRLNDILNLIKSAIGITLDGDTVEFPDFILDTIDKNPIDLSLNHGIPSSDFLNMSEMSHYDEIITTQLEPFRTFVKRANRELSSKL